MGEDVPSRTEAESLLSVMAGARSAAASGTQEAAAADLGRATAREATAPKRPERMGREEVEALEAIHDSLGRDFAAALSAMLRQIVKVKLTSVDQITYGEFVFRLDDPTCFNLLEAKPLEGYWSLDINPSILYPIIDRLLGGGREDGPHARRPLTEIELRLVSLITGLFLEELRRAWENVLDLSLDVVRVESNPRSAQIVPPNEPVVLVGFQLAIGEVHGMMNLCIPHGSIQRISGQLSAISRVAHGKHQPSPEHDERLGHDVNNSLVEVVTRLAQTRITTGELTGLRVGDIITTEQNVHGPLLVTVEGVPKFRASPGAYKNHKAIRIEQVIDDAKRAAGE